MIVYRLDLDDAVAQGIISRDQALQLQDLSNRDRVKDGSRLDFAQETRDEPFRLLRGFRDVFIAIGVAIFSVGVTAAAFAFLGDLDWGNGRFLRSDTVGIGSIAVAAVLCLAGFGQAEIVTRRQRLPLASLVVSIWFGVWWAILFAIIAINLLFVARNGVEIVVQPGLWAFSLVSSAAVAGALLGVTVFYWRYRLPFALLLLAAAFVGLTLLLLEQTTGDGWLDRNARLTIGVSGVLVFIAAMWFDVKDRLRVTRFSECAFWLHLLAAPMMVHAILISDMIGGPRPVIVLGTMAILALIALMIDRRALLVSGLSYMAATISQLISGSSHLAEQEFAITAFILGAVMLTLGLGWTPIRRSIVRALPSTALTKKLPPIIE